MTMDKLFDGSDAHLLLGNAELIANLRGENLECNCCAYSRSECSCDTCWPESFTNKAADALEAADKRIAEERETYDRMLEEGANKLAEAERKLVVARDELQNVKAISLRECGVSFVDENVLAQIGVDDAS